MRLIDMIIKHWQQLMLQPQFALAPIASIGATNMRPVHRRHARALPRAWSLTSW